jgi:hypothetical protein
MNGVAVLADAGRKGGLVKSATIHQWLPATVRLSAASRKRCLNAEASVTARKQYRTAFAGRSTYMSHSNGQPSSQSSTSIAASSKDSSTWNGKSRLILSITPITALRTYQEHKVNIARASGITSAMDTRYGMLIGAVFLPLGAYRAPCDEALASRRGPIKRKKRLPFVTF